MGRRIVSAFDLLVDRANDSVVAVVEPEPANYIPAKTLLQLGEKANTAQKNFKAFGLTVSRNQQLFHGFEVLDIDCTFSPDNDYIVVQFTGDDARLGVVWGLLRRHGFNTQGRPTKGEPNFYAFWDR